MLRILSAFLLTVILPAAAQSPASPPLLSSPQVIPVARVPVGGVDFIQIPLSLGGGAAKNYIFDTGFSDLNAAWVQGAPWWGPYTLITAEPPGSPVKASNSRFYYNAVATAVTVGALTSSSQYLVSQDYRKQTVNPDGTWTTDSKWKLLLLKGQAPETGGFYGNFGADLSDDRQGFYGFIRQFKYAPSLTEGFIVHAGGMNPEVIVGLTPENTAGFTVTTPMNTQPNGYSRRVASADYGLTGPDGQQLTLGKSVPTIFDSGDPSIFLQRGLNLRIPDNLIDAKGLLKPGFTLQLTIGSLVWQVSSSDTAILVSGSNTDPDGGTNIGIDFFNSFDIMYDTRNGIIGYRALPDAAYSIPIYQSYVGGTHLLVGAGINGGPILPYLLDSGSPNLFATYGSWTPGLPKRTKQGDGSFGFADGISYYYDPVKVDIALGDFVSGITTVTAKGVNIAQITNIGTKTPAESSALWQTRYNNGGTALNDVTFGNFSAGLYGTSSLATLLPQMPLPPGYKAGYVIKSGGIQDGAVGTLEIGLSPRLISQYTASPFATALDMNPSGNKIPGPRKSDGTGTLLNGVGKAQLASTVVSLTNAKGFTYSYKLPTVLDTGGGEKNIIYRASVQPSLTRDTKGTGQVNTGVQFNLSADGAPFYSYLAGITPSDDLIVVDPQYKAADGFPRINPGIAFFYAYNVMFDVADGKIGLLPNPTHAAANPQVIAPFAPITGQIYGQPLTVTLPVASSGLHVTLSVASGPATLTGRVLTFTGTGVVTLAANQAGNASYKPAPEVRTSFSVARAAQTITFSAIPDQSAATRTYILKATSSSGLPVSYKVSGPATVTGSTLNLLLPGRVSVGAYCAGNADYTTAPEVRQVFQITTP